MWAGKCSLALRWALFAPIQCLTSLSTFLYDCLTGSLIFQEWSYTMVVGDVHGLGSISKCVRTHRVTQVIDAQDSSVVD